jgi:hypothetical protein
MVARGRGDDAKKERNERRLFVGLQCITVATVGVGFLCAVKVEWKSDRLGWAFLVLNGGFLLGTVFWAGLRTCRAWRDHPQQAAAQGGAFVQSNLAGAGSAALMTVRTAIYADPTYAARESAPAQPSVASGTAGSAALTSARAAKDTDPNDVAQGSAPMQPKVAGANSAASVPDDVGLSLQGGGQQQQQPSEAAAPDEVELSLHEGQQQKQLPGEAEAHMGPAPPPNP